MSLRGGVGGLYLGVAVPWLTGRSNLQSDWAQMFTPSKGKYGNLPGSADIPVHLQVNLTGVGVIRETHVWEVSRRMFKKSFTGKESIILNLGTILWSD